VFRLALQRRLPQLAYPRELTGNGEHAEPPSVHPVTSTSLTKAHLVSMPFNMELMRL
jgi:hypothetical protein